MHNAINGNPPAKPGECLEFIAKRVEDWQSRRRETALFDIELSRENAVCDEASMQGSEGRERAKPQIRAGEAGSRPPLPSLGAPTFSQF